MNIKYSPDEEGIDKMFNFFTKDLENQGLENFKIAGDISPSTIFLAGAPGAGKTEFIETIKDNCRFVIIDIDKYRVLFSGYNGNNASDFQSLSTKIANKIYKYCMKNNLNVIIDGTFGNLNIIEQNIQQCIKYNRDFGVVLIYQDPILSYFYTKVRELEGKRNVPKEVFITKFFESINNAFHIKRNYPNIFFMFAYKNSRGIFQTKKNVIDKKTFDKTIGTSYNEKELMDELDYIDESFKISINIRKTYLRLKNKFINLYNLIMIKLGIKKKDKKRKNNSKS